MLRLRDVVTTLALVLCVGCAHHDHPVANEPSAIAPKLPAPLFNDLGKLHHAITTQSPLAQRYFDQGLTLAYGFNHPEAIRSFEAATKVDPECAMGYWGIALASGPNINRPMDKDDVARAWSALRKAVALSPQVSEKEQAYIAALTRRYEANPPDDRSALDRAYADEMRNVAHRYPDDVDAATLFAEALMDTMPWNYWQKDLGAKPATAEAKAVLESVIRRAPDHPGAHHFYIHLVEAGPEPKLGEPSADKLNGLIPGAGHLVHMPAHIFVRVGRYHEAVEVNHRAAKADESYIAQCNAQGFYPAAYYPHNLHFTWYAAMMSGESFECIGAARHAMMHMKDNWVEAERLRPMLLFALVRFGRWDDVRTLEKPPTEARFATALWHYGQGLAELRAGHVASAEAHTKELTAIVDSDAAKTLEQPGFYGHTQLRIADAVLRGELASARGDHDAAVKLLGQAVAHEDSLPYMEPPYWPYPTRHILGAELLRAGLPAEAEKVYREDLREHPRNGWALYGLVQSLKAQGNDAAAAEVEKQLKDAWKDGDVKLTASEL